jgi:hypothetical protein
MKKQMSAPQEEPEQKRFELPSEGLHKFQVVDIFPDKTNPDAMAVKLEVSEGEELGRSILHRVNLDSAWKGFFLTRLFLKAIGEPYKGDFEADSDMWIGKQFSATIVHNKSDKTGKTYANIDSYEFDAVTEVKPGDTKQVKSPKDIEWKE